MYTLYPDFQYEKKNISLYKLRQEKEQVLEATRSAIKNGKAKALLRYHVSLPTLDVHSDHPVASAASFCQRVHPTIKWEVFKPLFPVSQLHYPVPITDDPCSDSCNFQPLTHIELLYFKGQHYDCILSTSTGKPSTTQPELHSTLPVCTIQLDA